MSAKRSVLSLQGQGAADKINRRSLNTLTGQSTVGPSVCVCVRKVCQLRKIRTFKFLLCVFIGNLSGKQLHQEDMRCKFKNTQVLNPGNKKKKPSQEVDHFSSTLKFRSSILPGSNRKLFFPHGLMIEDSVIDPTSLQL